MPDSHSLDCHGETQPWRSTVLHSMMHGKALDHDFLVCCTRRQISVLSDHLCGCLGVQREANPIRRRLHQ